MQQEIDSRLDQAREKLGFLTKFLNPIIKMLGDREFFGLPLKILYYLIAISNLFLPLGVLAMTLYLFTFASYFPFWAWITIPLICLVLLAISIVVGVGSFAFWIRRLDDILEYNRHTQNYMALRNFALMQRTFGEWLGLILMFLGVVDLLFILVPSDVIDGFGAPIPSGIVATVLEAISLVACGYIVIFLAKTGYDYLESIANRAADIRDLADLERAKLEMEE